MARKQEITNKQIADQLERVSELLEALGRDQYRAGSYRRAASVARQTSQSLASLWNKQGREGLQEFSGIGERLAGSIGELVDTGKLGLLDRLQTELSPENVLARVPGVGEKLAHQIHSELGIESLEELERAAHDGRLKELDGVGSKTVKGIRDALAGMLSRSARRQAKQRQESSRSTTDTESSSVPPVDLLLDLDAVYREKAENGELRRIAPRRFNPEGEAWLPILKTRRQGWRFTALFSNTAKAHELGKTDDWVVLYYKKNGKEDQCTVVTKSRRPLQGKRVVRGREQECREYYNN